MENNDFFVETLTVLSKRFSQRISTKDDYQK